MSAAENVDLSRLRIQHEENLEERPRRAHRTGIILYAAGAMFLALVAFVFIRTSLGSAESVELATVSFVSPSQSNEILTASGYIVAQQKAAVASKATGRIVFLGHHEGDNVRKGDIIARIESADVEAALAQAQAELALARADREDAQRSLERSQAMLSRELISQAEFDAAKARSDRVRATIQSKEAAVRAAGVQVENTRIRAPFDGTILTKNADVGEVVAPFAAGASSRVAVVTIADMSSLEVEADVSESNIERIAVEQPCEIALDAYPDKRYRGTVDKIVPTADRAKATVLTKIRFLERDSRVLPEMSAKVHFLAKGSSGSASSKPRLVVDSTAIVVRDGRKVAFSLRGDEASAVRVELGDPIGRFSEILSGLSAGDRVRR
ncbi:MAG: efflux RND transporter periplasmic adaptor subunit [Ignavibacteria bacterium]|nr:MAG: efflux RND transporter periplasmic adaptor subunit [Ignavibacteria bacterium]